jgi:hypothetical protein
MRRSSGAAAHPVAPFIYGSLDDMLSRLCTCREGIEWVWPRCAICDGEFPFNPGACGLALPVAYLPRSPAHPPAHLLRPSCCQCAETWYFEVRASWKKILEWSSVTWSSSSASIFSNGTNRDLASGRRSPSPRIPFCALRLSAPNGHVPCSRHAPFRSTADSSEPLCCLLVRSPRASVRTRPELACEPSLGLEAMRGAAISVALLMRCGGASGSCSLRAGRVGRGRSIAWTLPRPAPAPAALGRSGWCGGVMARTAGCGSGTQKCCVSSCRCEHPAREVRCWSVLWVVMGVL